MMQVLPLNVGLDHDEAPSLAAAVDHSLSPVVASEKSPSPRAEQTPPVLARVTSRKGAGRPRYLPRTSRCRRRAATLSNRRNGRAEPAERQPRCLRPRPARWPPRLRVTIPPLTVTAPGAARASRSPRARPPAPAAARSGSPVRPAAPRSL